MSSPACLTSQFQRPRMNARDGTYPELTLSLTLTQQICGCRIWLQEVQGVLWGCPGLLMHLESTSTHLETRLTMPWCLVGMRNLPRGHHASPLVAWLKRKENKTKTHTHIKTKHPLARNCRHSVWNPVCHIGVHLQFTIRGEEKKYIPPLQWFKSMTTGRKASLLF